MLPLGLNQSIASNTLWSQGAEYNTCGPTGLHADDLKLYVQTLLTPRYTHGVECLYYVAVGVVLT